MFRSEEKKIKLIETLKNSLNLEYFCQFERMVLVTGLQYMKTLALPLIML